MYRSACDLFDSLHRGLHVPVDRFHSGFRGEQGGGADDSEAQRVPVNVFETGTELVLVAPMPGMEATNIDIQVEDAHLTIKAEKRGPGQERHHYLCREWSYGPYERTIELPSDMHVDVDRANATYNNGIVTIALPKAASPRTGRIKIHLVQVGGTRGEYVGHRGSAEMNSKEGVGGA